MYNTAQYKSLYYPPTHNREPYDTRIVLSNIMFL